MSIKSIKEKELLVNFARAKYEPDDGPLTKLQIEQIKESVKEAKNELVQTQPKKESPKPKHPYPIPPLPSKQLPTVTQVNS
jgi:hypothetical protein